MQSDNMTNDPIDMREIPLDPDDNLSDSDISDMSDEEEESAPTPMPPPKAPKAPKKKTATPKGPKKVAVKKKVVKTKKPKTIRRPYKSMPQDKLETKQSVAFGRFEVASKRLSVIQGQLERFDYEIATRVAMPVVDEVDEDEGGCVETPSAL